MPDYHPRAPLILSEAPRPNPAMIEEGLLNRCPKA